MSAQDDLVPVEKVPKCVKCPHPALDHEGDGWGVDDHGSFDWFKCYDSTCDCRVKGYIHYRTLAQVQADTAPETAQPAPTAVAAPPGAPANWQNYGFPFG